MIVFVKNKIFLDCSNIQSNSFQVLETLIFMALMIMFPLIPLLTCSFY